jgi:hypothetical protein
LPEGGGNGGGENADENKKGRGYGGLGTDVVEGRSNPSRHCEERSDEAISSLLSTR